ncbi:MAG TPA: hypothetical protein VE780_12035 [Thermoleophilaceae bacterium]|nr:hypothetical protein [Thermoleophilaceae bacterium]
MRRGPALAALAAALAGLAAPGASAAGASPEAAVPALIRTVPAVPGMRFSLAGSRFRADGGGRARPPASARASSGALKAIETEVRPGVRAKLDRWYAGRRIAAIKLYYLVRPRFVDLDGGRVDPRVVSSTTLEGSGGRHVVRGGGAAWLKGNRVPPEGRGRRSSALSYGVQRVMVAGTSVVHRGQQRIVPRDSRQVELRLLLFSARFTVRDALLGFPIGSAVRVRYPDGHEQREALGPGAQLTLTSLPRGNYRVSADAPGTSSSRPVALSRDQRVDLRVVSWLDVVVVLLGIGSIAIALLFARRRAQVLVRRRRGRATATFMLMLVCAAAWVLLAPAPKAAARPDPLFAYYYIWFNPSSWSRAKLDYPLLGRYSSDDRAVMRKHVEWAKRAGITGFIVSWKSTPVLDRRLERLIDVAESERFKLLLIYQGLDFHRRPLPPARVASDLDLFERRFAHRRPFQVFDKPLVIWSGTPRFSPAELGRVTAPRRSRLLILASERKLAGYRRVAGLFDGDAYYWGSVNPATYPGYAEKLAELGRAVHARGGLWIAPAAPGFDARKVGRRQVVERENGATLRAELDAATRSSPDALGLISWNEFSENTYVEPSRRYGWRYLRVLADVRGARVPPQREFDSSEPAATGTNYVVPLLGGVALFIGGSLVLLVRRARRRGISPRG